MSLKIPSKKISLVIILTGFIFLIFAFNFKRLTEGGVMLFNGPEKIKPANVQENSKLTMRLKIPVINVDAQVESLGLTSAGAMATPKKPDNVAWFNLGPRPSDKGSAVIAGHYGWENGKAAAFDNLSKLHQGDKIYFEDVKGVTTTFVVREIKNYDSNADAKDVFNSNDNKSHLNLITCEGVWDKISKSYSGRLVVFTDKEI